MGFYCKFGVHLWKEFGSPKTYPDYYRVCKSCGKRQYGSYDMAYGETFWTDSQITRKVSE